MSGLFGWIGRMFRRRAYSGEVTVRISCPHVWQEISDYVEGDVDAELRARMEAHFKTCKHCTAVLDGMRNLIRLTGDGEVFEVPPGFGERVERRLMERIRLDENRAEEPGTAKTESEFGAT